ncbi:VanW family protein [Candidatus Peregrinibacteria bacterium]|nr:VanW family protein [Candidatus Peregrinibacteria bacterium]
MKKKRIVLTVVLGVTIGLVAAFALAYAKFSVHGKFAPGTFVASVDISYMETEEAKAALEVAANEYLDTEIKISLFNRTRGLSPRELGVELLVGETIDSLKKTDARNLGFFDFLLSRNYGEENFALAVTVDSEKLFTTLEKHLELSSLEPKSATMYLDEQGGLAIKEGQDGLLIEEKDFLKKFKEQAKQLKSGPLELITTREAPQISAAMLELERPKVEEALNHQFSLLDPVYSDDWQVKLSEHLDWVKFKQKQKVDLPYGKEAVLNDPVEGFSAGTLVSIEIDQNNLNKFVDEKISKWLDRPAEPVNIYLDESGEVVVEGKGSDGLKIQREKLKKAIELAVENRIVEVPIPVQEIKPEINIAKELQEKGIKERIAVGHTSYYGSPANRVHNIKTGAAKFNGKLIAPGEIFSFNENLGPVDGSTGYKKELVIKQEGTIPEFGGGICQVSTTMYRAILLGALPIVERNQHSYAVSYYSQILGHGLDATIYLGGADLKFQNDTGNHLLVQTYTENDYELYIVFYGTDTGKTVELEGPYISNQHSPGATQYIETDKLPVGQTKQVERAHSGFDALWYRHIADKDGNLTTEEINTKYKAVPSKIWVGTATE